jgi:hypothetical protein
MSPNQTLRIAGLALVSALGLAPLIAVSALPGQASECGRPMPVSTYSMEVLVDGRPLAVYNAGGTTYVEALKGREYAIRLTNHTGERVAAALAVDGLNSIDARHTSSQDARKWILAPWETVTLSGWQTGSGTARRFVFTSEPKSYGAWLGRTSDLGVISAAFFRESRRRDEIAAEPSLPQQRPVEGGAEGDSANAAPRAKALGEMKASAKDQLAATGIGREIEHRVVRVEFDAEDVPASTVSVRYEYRDALVRLGVLPAVDEELARRERARGFADSGFAPDPFRSRQ